MSIAIFTSSYIFASVEIAIDNCVYFCKCVSEGREEREGRHRERQPLWPLTHSAPYSTSHATELSSDI